MQINYKIKRKFQSSYLGKNEFGISVLDLNKSKVNEIKAIEKTVKGSLIYLKENQIITVKNYKNS